MYMCSLTSLKGYKDGDGILHAVVRMLVDEFVYIFNYN